MPHLMHASLRITMDESSPTDLPGMPKAENASYLLFKCTLAAIMMEERLDAGASVRRG